MSIIDCLSLYVCVPLCSCDNDTVFKCYDPASVKSQVKIVLILRKMKMLESFCFAIRCISIDIIDDVW